MSECKGAERGLDDTELASLTGFTSRASRMLAHLREAWLSADDSNSTAIEAALVELFRGQSFQRNKAMFIRILTHGLDEGAAARITRGIR